MIVRETHENRLTKLLPQNLFTNIFVNVCNIMFKNVEVFVSALKQLMRGQIFSFFHDSELIASIYISPQTLLCGKKTYSLLHLHTQLLLYIHIIILSICFSFTISEVSTAVVYVIFRFNNIMTAVFACNAFTDSTGRNARDPTIHAAASPIAAISMTITARDLQKLLRSRGVKCWNWLTYCPSIVTGVQRHAL